MQNYRDIIKGPIMTEKSINVKVESVNTVTVRPRKKRVGKYTGYTNKVKNAIVKLKDGSSIELN